MRSYENDNHLTEEEIHELWIAAIKTLRTYVEVDGMGVTEAFTKTLTSQLVLPEHWDDLWEGAVKKYGLPEEGAPDFMQVTENKFMERSQKFGPQVATAAAIGDMLLGEG